MATNAPPAPPTACDVLANLRHAAAAITAAAADIEACTGHPLSDDDLGCLYNAHRVTQVAQGTMDQAAKQLHKLLDAVNQKAANVA